MSSLLHRSNFRAAALLCFILALSLICIPATFLTTGASANVRLPRSKPPAPVAANRIKQIEPRAAYGALPLSFELNQGQTNDRVRFLARSAGYLLFLTATEAVVV